MLSVDRTCGANSYLSLFHAVCLFLRGGTAASAWTRRDGWPSMADPIAFIKAVTGCCCCCAPHHTPRGACWWLLGRFAVPCGIPCIHACTLASHRMASDVDLWRTHVVGVCVWRTVVQQLACQLLVPALTRDVVRMTLGDMSVLCVHDCMPSRGCPVPLVALCMALVTTHTTQCVWAAACSCLLCICLCLICVWAAACAG